MIYQSLEIFLNSVLDHLLLGVTNVMGNLPKNQIIIKAFGSCLGNGVFLRYVTMLFMCIKVIINKILYVLTTDNQHFIKQTPSKQLPVFSQKMS